MAAEEVPPERIAQCDLDRAGLNTQLARYGELSRHVEAMRRSPGVLEVSFRPDVDAGLLGEALAVERGCCPFFDLTYDGSARRLWVTVDASHDAALDALRFALTPA